MIKMKSLTLGRLLKPVLNLGRLLKPALIAVLVVLVLVGGFGLASNALAKPAATRAQMPTPASHLGVQMSDVVLPGPFGIKNGSVAMAPAQATPVPNTPTPAPTASGPKVADMSRSELEAFAEKMLSTQEKAFGLTVDSNSPADARFAAIMAAIDKLIKQCGTASTATPKPTTSVSATALPTTVPVRSGSSSGSQAASSSGASAVSYAVAQQSQSQSLQVSLQVNLMSGNTFYSTTYNNMVISWGADWWTCSGDNCKSMDWCAFWDSYSPWCQANASKCNYELLAHAWKECYGNEQPATATPGNGVTPTPTQTQGPITATPTPSATPGTPGPQGCVDPAVYEGFVKQSYIEGGVGLEHLPDRIIAVNRLNNGIRNNINGATWNTARAWAQKELDKDEDWIVWTNDGLILEGTVVREPHVFQHEVGLTDGGHGPIRAKNMGFPTQGSGYRLCPPGFAALPSVINPPPGAGGGTPQPVVKPPLTGGGMTVERYMEIMEDAFRRVPNLADVSPRIEIARTTAGDGGTDGDFNAAAEKGKPIGWGELPNGFTLDAADGQLFIYYADLKGHLPDVGAGGMFSPETGVNIGTYGYWRVRGPVKFNFAGGRLIRIVGDLSKLPVRFNTGTAPLQLNLTEASPPATINLEEPPVVSQDGDFRTFVLPQGYDGPGFGGEFAP